MQTVLTPAQEAVAVVLRKSLLLPLDDLLSVMREFFERVAPRITRVLTDNGKEFTDRLFGLRRRAATDNHEFYRLCPRKPLESSGPDWPQHKDLLTCA